MPWFHNSIEDRSAKERGAPSWVALDAHCGMMGRFTVPELERVTAFLGARLVTGEMGYFRHNRDKME